MCGPCIMTILCIIFLLCSVFSYNSIFSTARCKPDAETYNALINAHGRARQWRWAMNIMDDMLRAAVGICFLPYLIGLTVCDLIWLMSISSFEIIYFCFNCRVQELVVCIFRSTKLLLPVFSTFCSPVVFNFLFCFSAWSIMYIVLNQLILN